jgi:hypothetical protein
VLIYLVLRIVLVLDAVVPLSISRTRTIGAPCVGSRNKREARRIRIIAYSGIWSAQWPTLLNFLHGIDVDFHEVSGVGSGFTLLNRIHFGKFNKVNSDLLKA